jgi:hypothetical protein
MRSFVLVACLCLLAVSSPAQEPLPEQQPFLQEVRKHLETDDERQSGYAYTETRRETKLDKSGQPTGGESLKVFESYPGLPGEPRWSRVISEDGRPVPPAELEKKDRERREHVEEYARNLAKDPVKERAKQDKERERERRERYESIDELFRVFDVRMQGREAIDGHDTIAFSLAPRPGVKPSTREGRMMVNFSGRAWISESDHELVRAEVEAIDTVSFGFGLLARVHKGSRVAFQRRKVNGEVWLPAVVTYSATARIALVKMFRRGGTAEFSNYKKFSVDTSTTIATPKQ